MVSVDLRQLVVSALVLTAIGCQDPPSPIPPPESFSGLEVVADESSRTPVEKVGKGAEITVIGNIQSPRKPGGAVGVKVKRGRGDYATIVNTAIATMAVGDDGTCTYTARLTAPKSTGMYHLEAAYRGEVVDETTFVVE